MIYSTTPVFAIAIQKFKETNSKTCSGQVEIEMGRLIRKYEPTTAIILISKTKKIVLKIIDEYLRETNEVHTTIYDEHSLQHSKRCIGFEGIKTLSKK